MFFDRDFSCSQVGRYDSGRECRKGMTLMSNGVHNSLTLRSLILLLNGVASTGADRRVSLSASAYAYLEQLLDWGVAVSMLRGLGTALSQTVRRGMARGGNAYLPVRYMPDFIFGDDPGAKVQTASGGCQIIKSTLAQVPENLKLFGG